MKCVLNVSLRVLLIIAFLSVSHASSCSQEHLAFPATQCVGSFANALSACKANIPSWGVVSGMDIDPSGCFSLYDCYWDYCVWQDTGCLAGQSPVGCTSTFSNPVVNGLYNPTSCDTGACVAPSCNAGQYLSGTTCTTCATGKYSDGGTVTACSSCTNGNAYSTYTGSGTTATNCPTSCAAGTYKLTGVCTSCATGTYSAGGASTSCSACTNTVLYGTLSGPGTTATNCPISCIAGAYKTGSSCTPCYAGTYSTSIGATVAAVCTPCPAGSYNPSTASNAITACLPCPVGSFGNTVGSSI